MTNVSYINLDEMVNVTIKGLTNRFTFIDNNGNVIVIKKNNNSCTIILKSINYTLTETFTLLEFDNDFVEFNNCIKDIIKDTLNDGYILADTFREVKYID